MGKLKVGAYKKEVWRVLKAFWDAGIKPAYQFGPAEFQL